MDITRSEIDSLYVRYGHIIYHRCRKLLGEDEEARDAMQEVFVRLIRSSGGMRGEASPLTWLYRVSTNLCLNRLRDARSRARKLAAPDPGSGQIPGHGAFASLDPVRRNLVTSLLDKVDEETRAVVIYYFVDEMTLDEISAVMNLSAPTLRKRIQNFQGVARRTLGILPVPVAILLLLGCGSLAAHWPALHPAADSLMRHV